MAQLQTTFGGELDPPIKRHLQIQEQQHRQTPSASVGLSPDGVSASPPIGKPWRHVGSSQRNITEGYCSSITIPDIYPRKHGHNDCGSSPTSHCAPRSYHVSIKSNCNRIYCGYGQRIVTIVEKGEHVIPVVTKP